METWHVKLGDSELICNVDKKSKTEGSQSGERYLGGNYIVEKNPEECTENFEV